MTVLKDEGTANILSLQEKVHNLDQVIATLSTEGETKKSKIEEQHEEIRKLKDKNSELNKQTQSNMLEKEEIKHQVSLLSEQIFALNAVQEKNQREISDLSQQLQLQTEENRSLTHKLREAESTIEKNSQQFSMEREEFLTKIALIQEEKERELQIQKENDATFHRLEKERLDNERSTDSEKSSFMYHFLIFILSICFQN